MCRADIPRAIMVQFAELTITHHRNGTYGVLDAPSALKMAILKKLQVASPSKLTEEDVQRQAEVAATDTEPLIFRLTPTLTEAQFFRRHNKVPPVKLSTSLLLQWISETATSHAGITRTWSLKGPPSSTNDAMYVPVRKAHHMKFPGSAGTGVDFVGGALMGRHAGE